MLLGDKHVKKEIDAGAIQTDGCTCTTHERYSCKICKDFNTETEFIIWLHISDIHGMSKKEYQRKYGATACSHVILEKCQRCYLTNNLVNLNATENILDFTDTHHNTENSILNTPKAQAKILSRNANQQLTKNQVIDWANKCEFMCGECNKTFRSFRTLTEKHILKQHKLTKATYIALHGKEMRLIAYHQCMVCHEDVIHNYDNIVEHLKEIHHNQYGNQPNAAAILNYYTLWIKPNVPQPQTQKTNSPQLNVTTAKTKTPPKKKEQKLKFNQVVHWSNKCEYRCGVCGITKTSFRSLMKNHVVKEHTVTKSDYISKYGKEMSLVVHHRCKICCKKILHSYATIVTHLKKRHCNLKIVNYYEVYIDPNQPSPQTSSLNLKKPANVQLERLSGDLGEKEITIEDTAECKSVMEELFFEDWTSPTTYHCKECGFATKSKEEHTIHILTYRPCSLNTKNGLGLTSDVIIHRCIFCEKKVIRDRTRLNYHLTNCIRNTHSLSLKDYFHKYILPGEFKIASGQLDLIEDNSLSASEKHELMDFEHQCYNSYNRNDRTQG